MHDKQQDDEMICGLGIAERDLLRSRRADLPDTVPPHTVWKRIQEQAQAEGLLRRSQRVDRLRWVAGAAVAATVAMFALNVTLVKPPEDETFPTVPAQSATSSPIDLTALKAESRDLERNLRLLPDQPAVMKVSTATTIREIEERIAAIDFRLNDQSIAMDKAQEEIYWRERVRLMNLLVQMRVVQAQRAGL